MIGIEPDWELARQAARRLDLVLPLPAETGLEALRPGIDCLVFADVLEHTTDPAGVLEKARAGGEFEALAREYSDGPSASRGGDLGSFGRGAMLPSFDEAVFALEVGEISDTVETRFGCHVILRYE